MTGKPSLADYEEAALRGDAHAAHYVGSVYYYGKDERGKTAPRDKEKGIRFLLLARDTIPGAAYTVAMAKVMDRDVDGIKEIGRLAELGYPPALHEMGVENIAGWFGPKDEDSALLWFSKAAEKGQLLSTIAMTRIQLSRLNGASSLGIRIALHFKMLRALLKTMFIMTRNPADVRVAGRPGTEVLGPRRKSKQNA